MELQPEDLIGSYRVVRALGQGGMGAVYEVEHVKLGVHYALKTFTLADGHVELFRQRFLAEGKVLARLSHPNIARVFYLDYDEGSGFAYRDFRRMPFAQGGRGVDGSWIGRV